MAYPELKTESYTLLGGMNSKASPYNNGPMEFRELTNFQFSQPGAIDSRYGTTLYCAGLTTLQVNGLYEYTKLNGTSFLINTNPYKVFAARPTGQTLIYSYGSTFMNKAFDFVTFVDTLFMTTQPYQAQPLDSYNPLETGLRKFNGSTTYYFGLPGGVYFGSTQDFGVTGGIGGSLTLGVTTTFTVGYGYINTLGYYGPISRSPFTDSPLTVTIDGTTHNSIIFKGMQPPPYSDYGATSIVIYRSLDNQTVPFAATFASLTGSSFLLSEPGITSQESNEDYFGGGGFLDIFSLTFFPSFMELYNNQLFLGGILVNAAITAEPETTYKSTIFWSEIGIPEKISPENSLEVRTNDGDIVSGLKAYNNALVISKRKSLHQLSGSDPTNFNLSQITDQYGCLSNRAMVIFNNLLWMLDSKGIVEYNGANTQIVSTKMDPVFARMNISAAQDQSWGVFYKELNQIWFSFPVDGSTKNNMIVVYDLIAQAWTKFEGLDISVGAISSGALSKPHVFWGGYSGSIYHFGASFTNDYGKSGITYLFQTPYYAPSGQTVERQFRRFYMNVNPITGSSTPVNMRFLPDFGSTIGHTAVIYQAPFQTRIDFGVPAKSLSAVGTFFSATFPISIGGYTFESRYQRNT